MAVEDINSKEYWNNRFETNWNAFQGDEQTTFFADIAINLLPEWITEEFRSEEYSICDLGCAEGEGVNLLSNHLGYNIDGSDFSEVAIEKAQKKYPDNNFFVIDLFHIPEDFSYDVVFCSNVLEHFAAPWSIIENLSLKVNKYLILMVPFQETMEVEEHVFKFDTNQIPMNINDFSLVYTSTIDCKTIKNTYYADKQILLIYSKLKNIKQRTNLDSVIDSTNNYNDNTTIDNHNKNKELEISIINLEKYKKRLEDENNILRKNNEDYANRLKEDDEKYRSLENEYNQFKINIYNSFSWKMTAIVRAISKLVRFHRIHQQIVNSKHQTDTRNTGIKIIIYKIRKSKIYPLIRKLIPTNIRYKLSRKYHSNYVLHQTSQENMIEIRINNFIQKISEQDQIILVFSGVKYIDNEGQRNIRLVHEAIKKNIRIIFAYWRWDPNEIIEETNDKILQIPIDYLYHNRKSFFENYLKTNINKSVLIEFPHPFATEIIDIANCFEWKTIYDVIDDWEEFSKKGQAVWYNRAVETRIANMVDLNISTAARLKEKISERIYNKNNYYIISNGVDPNRMKKAERDNSYDFRKGKLQIGYFGHLTDAWFDWELVKTLAQRNNEWTFHIIGYGQPDNLKVPDNIILYGKKEPSELPKYAAFWDVAMIPFINCELTLSVNPIKIYEYLQLMLPTVTSNMPEVKNFPYTKIAIGVEQFEREIRDLAGIQMDSSLIKQFIASNTWEEKLNQLLNYINEFKLEETYKQIYIADHEE